MDAYRDLVEKKRPWPRPDANAQARPANGPTKDHACTQPDPYLDAIWRLAVGLDLGSRSVLEAEVLMWRICTAKSLPHETIRRALNEDWEDD